MPDQSLQGAQSRTQPGVLCEGGTHLVERTHKTTGRSVVIYVGRDAGGKPKYKWHTVKGGKRDAQRELSRLLNEVNNNTYVEPSRLTVEHLLEKWLLDYAAHRVSDKTYERYEEIIRLHIIPALGKQQLSKLKPAEIQAYYSEALRSGRKDGKGGLSPQTVLHHHRVLREALHHAVRWQLIPRNPADHVTPPRVERKEFPVLDAVQVRALLDACQDTVFYLPVVIAVTTGMRRGEILALRWGDIDLQQGKISVRRTLEQTAKGLKFKETKTTKSTRVIMMPHMTREVLSQRLEELAEEKRILGPDYQDNDLVCAYHDGRPIPPEYISSNFRFVIARTGLPHIRFHDLRHTHATILLGAGTHPKVVSERLGHSTIAITMDTYSHVLPNMQREAAEMLDQALRIVSTQESSSKAGE